MKMIKILTVLILTLMFSTPVSADPPLQAEVLEVEPESYSLSGFSSSDLCEKAICAFSIYNENEKNITVLIEVIGDESANWIKIPNEISVRRAVNSTTPSATLVNFSVNVDSFAREHIYQSNITFRYLIDGFQITTNIPLVFYISDDRGFFLASLEQGMGLLERMKLPLPDNSLNIASISALSIATFGGSIFAVFLLIGFGRFVIRKTWGR